MVRQRKGTDQQNSVFETTINQKLILYQYPLLLPSNSEKGVGDFLCTMLFLLTSIFLWK